MAGIDSYGELADAYENGRYHITHVRKVFSTNYAPAGQWYDTGYVGGGPPPNYYAATPGTFNLMSRSTNNGWNIGPDVPTGSTKYLARLNLLSPVHATNSSYVGVLCDYLAFVPFIDLSDNDVIPITSAPLTRYTNGEGVRMTLVMQGASGGVTVYPRITITYTNSQGVAGRVTTFQPYLASISGVVPMVSHSAAGAGSRTTFTIALQSGDTGVRSVESIQSIDGDGGLVCLLLIKPLVTVHFAENTGYIEKQFGINSPIMPVIENDACLNMMMMPSNLNYGHMFGTAEFIWN